MFSNTRFWPYDLLNRFLPSGFREEEQQTHIIRYDLDDYSSPVDNVDEFGKYVLCEELDDTGKANKRKYPHENDIINNSARTHSVNTVDSPNSIVLSVTKEQLPTTEQQNKVQHNFTLGHNRPVQLYEDKYFRSYRSSSVDNGVEDELFLGYDSILRRPYPRPCSPDISRNLSQQNYYLENGLFCWNTRVSPQSDFPNCDLIGNNFTKSKPCHEQLFQSKIHREVSVGTNISTKRKPRKAHCKTSRRHSLDHNFGFLTPENKAKIQDIRQSWEAFSSPKSSKRFSFDSFPCNKTCLKDTDSKSRVSTNSVSTEESLDSGFSSLAHQNSSSTESITSLITRLQKELSKPTEPISPKHIIHKRSCEDISPAEMELPEKYKHLTKKYQVHDESVSYLKILAEDKPIDPIKSTPAEVRATSERNLTRFGEEATFDGIVKDFTVPSIKCKAGIPVHVIRQKKLPQVPTIVIYFHGGGLVCGSRRNSDSFCKKLCKDAQCIVVNVEYRLAPEHRYPAAFDDANCVVRWVKMNLGLMGAVLESKIGVAGESAGGQLAASVTHEIFDLDFQILIYPVLDVSFGQPSITEFENGPGLSLANLTWFYDQVMTKPDEKYNPRISPLLRSDFQRQPPTFMLIAQIDPLRDAIYDYKQKLKEEGVPVTSYLVKGAPHGFFKYQGHFKELFQESYQQVVDFVKSLVL